MTIKELLGQATPPPWGDPDEYAYGDYGWYIPGSPLGEVADSDQALTDLKLAVTAVNHLPDYDYLALFAGRVVSWLSAGAHPDHGPTDEALDEARAALARLRGNA